jgi:hypothetical protein
MNPVNSQQIASDVVNFVATQTANLPDKYVPTYFLTWAVFYLGLIFLCLRILDHLAKAVRGNSLSIRLTKEVFSRVSDHGETWFLNAVFVAHDSPAMVKGISAKLFKIDGATKQFQLEMQRLGEKFRDNNAFPNFFFYSTSPILCIQPNSPQRLVFLMSVKDYQDKLLNAFQEFDFMVQKHFDENTKDWNGATPSPELVAEVASKAKLIHDEHEKKIIGSIQIEPGEYEIEVEVEYQQKGVFFPVFKDYTSNSKISFKVPKNAREILEVKIRECLRTILANRVHGQNQPLLYPEVTPTDIKEL